MEIKRVGTVASGNGPADWFTGSVRIDPLVQAPAPARGLKTLNGLPMLVYQGAIGFEMWTGKKAPEREMREALEKAFGPEGGPV